MKPFVRMVSTITPRRGVPVRKDYPTLRCQWQPPSEDPQQRRPSANQGFRQQTCFDSVQGPADWRRLCDRLHRREQGRQAAKGTQTQKRVGAERSD
jgi:hypothetical protein